MAYLRKRPPIDLVALQPLLSQLWIFGYVVKSKVFIAITTTLAPLHTTHVHHCHGRVSSGDVISASRDNFQVWPLGLSYMNDQKNGETAKKRANV